MNINCPLLSRHGLQPQLPMEPPWEKPIDEVKLYASSHIWNVLLDGVIWSDSQSFGYEHEKLKLKRSGQKIVNFEIIQRLFRQLKGHSSNDKDNKQKG